MKKEIKEFIANNKLTDEQIEKALKALVPEKPAEKPLADVPTPAEPKKDVKVEPESTSKETPKTSEESPDATGDKKKPISFSTEEFEALIKKKVDEALASQPKAQPKLHPTITNPNRPKQYKELKKNNG